MAFQIDNGLPFVMWPDVYEESPGHFHCPWCIKQFKATKYVHKHLHNKHYDELVAFMKEAGDSGDRSSHVAETAEDLTGEVEQCLPLAATDYIDLTV